MQTTSWTILRDYPKLRVDWEGVDDEIDILGIAVSQLSQDLDFVQDSLYAVVFLQVMNFEVMWIHIDNFQSHYFVSCQVIPLRIVSEMLKESLMMFTL